MCTLKNFSSHLLFFAILFSVKINHLSQLGEFSKEEEEAIAFVNQLERLYACCSFEKAKSIAMENAKG